MRDAAPRTARHLTRRLGASRPLGLGDDEVAAVPGARRAELAALQ
jgi:hypothetical protein